MSNVPLMQDEPCDDHECEKDVEGKRNRVVCGTDVRRRGYDIGHRSRISPDAHYAHRCINKVSQTSVKLRRNLERTDRGDIE